MTLRSAKITIGLWKQFDDPDYDGLLEEFCRLHPFEFEQWQQIEKHLFETRLGLGAYPDQALRTFCVAFIEARTIDERGGLAASHAWFVLRGRILRHLIDENRHLHPKPGKILVTEPRTHTDKELACIADAFSCAHPVAWADWHRIETAGDFSNDPLGRVSVLFSKFLRTHCWVQNNTACSTAFLNMRASFWLRQERTR